MLYTPTIILIHTYTTPFNMHSHFYGRNSTYSPHRNEYYSTHNTVCAMLRFGNVVVARLLRFCSMCQRMCYVHLYLIFCVMMISCEDINKNLYRELSGNGDLNSGVDVWWRRLCEKQRLNWLAGASGSLVNRWCNGEIDLNETVGVEETKRVRELYSDSGWATAGYTLIITAKLLWKELHRTPAQHLVRSISAVRGVLYMASKYFG